MSDQLINGDKFDLPFGLGTLEVVSEKQRYKVEEGKLNTKLFQIDWPTTYAYWEKRPEALKEKKLFYYINDHSDGNRYKFYWGKFGVKKRQIRYYSFHPSRLLSRRLAAHILDPDTIKNYSERC